MRIETYGHEIEVTPALREYVETKLKRLERHFDQPFEVRTQLCTRKPDYVAEATLSVAGRKPLHADAGAQTMYAAIGIDAGGEEGPQGQSSTRCTHVFAGDGA